MSTRQLGARHVGARHIWARHILACLTLLLSALAWTAAVVLKTEPWSSEGAAVICAGLVTTVAVAVIAIMIEGSRFGYWLGIFGLAVMCGVAVLRPLDWIWVVAALVTFAAGLLMADRRLGGWIRLEPSVAPVPPVATALGLILLIAPTLTAISTYAGTAGGIVWLALAAWSVLLIYVRRVAGVMAVIRIGIPLLIGGIALLDLPASVVWAVSMLSGSALAWSKPVRLAVRPLIERGSRVSIPPELLPEDVRRSAGIDRDRA